MDPTLSERHHRYRVKAGRAKAALYARVIENKRYTMRQIADELGVSMTTADTRVKRGPYPLTWKSLRLARLPASNKELQVVIPDELHFRVPTAAVVDQIEGLDIVRRHSVLDVMAAERHRTNERQAVIND